MVFEVNLIVPPDEVSVVVEDRICEEAEQDKFEFKLGPEIQSVSSQSAL